MAFEPGSSRTTHGGAFCRGKVAFNRVLRRPLRVTVLGLAWLGGFGTASAGQTSNPAAVLRGGEELFRGGCAACHGAGGVGLPEPTIGFTKPATFPNFTQCDQTTPELQADWWSVIHEGGPARGFSPIMPAFGDLLTSPQIDALVKYLRSLCSDRHWPLGELNLPRALNTEKAFPEDETVYTVSMSAQRGHDATSELAYEHRFGVRNQLEVSVPLSILHDAAGTALAGIGDIGVGVKRALVANARTGTIASVQGGIHLPTGNKARGLGTGVSVFEVFGAFGQLLPSESFVQAQLGTDLPVDTADTPRAVFGRFAVGKSLRGGHSFGRLWTPMIELLSNRDLLHGAPTDLDLVPQMQVTLSARQHVRASAGLQLPVNHTEGRPVQISFYLLWDWFDGGFREGWK
jgi:mono/diheme cytochrome c family protein